MYGGDGANTFVWKMADLDGGTGIIKDFSIPGGDKLVLADVLPEGGVIDDLLNGNLVDFGLMDFGHEGMGLEINIDVGGKAQTIDVQFSGPVEVGKEPYATFTDFVQDYNSQGTEDQALMVEHLTKAMTGN